MARTNQAIFKKLINSFNDLQNQYETSIRDYFNCGEWNSDIDGFFTGFAYAADSIYTDANELIGNINGMLNSTKFEEDETKERYQTMLLQCQNIRNDIKFKFDHTLNLFEISGNYLTDIEKRTVGKLNIYSGF